MHVCSHRVKYFADVWITGDSYIHWAEQRATYRNNSKDLDVDRVSCIKWSGQRGMRWEQLMHKIQYLSLYNPPPKVLIIHVGCNDIASVRCNVMRNAIRNDILELSNLFPSTNLILSAMLPRRNWSRSDMPLDKIERKRKLLNRFMRRLVSYLGGIFIAHEDIKADTPGFYFADGIHLSDIGNDLFLLSIKEALEKIRK